MQGYLRLGGSKLQRPTTFMIGAVSTCWLYVQKFVAETVPDLSSHMRLRLCYLRRPLFQDRVADMAVDKKHDG